MEPACDHTRTHFAFGLLPTSPTFAHSPARPWQVGTRVIVVPASIDNTLSNAFVEVSVGFDSASRVYQQLIGNVLTDANSAKKYYYFLRLMGRAVSHLSLEAGLGCAPTVNLLGEELGRRRLSLAQLVDELADVVADRAASGRNFGTVVLPEGLLGHLPEMRQLLEELGAVWAAGHRDEIAVLAQLQPWCVCVQQGLPAHLSVNLHVCVP